MDILSKGVSSLIVNLSERKSRNNLNTSLEKLSEISGNNIQEQTDLIKEKTIKGEISRSDLKKHNLQVSFANSALSEESIDLLLDESAKLLSVINQNIETRDAKNDDESTILKSISHNARGGSKYRETIKEMANSWNVLAFKALKIIDKKNKLEESKNKLARFAEEEGENYKGTESIPLELKRELVENRVDLAKPGQYQEFITRKSRRAINQLTKNAIENLKGTSVEQELKEMDMKVENLLNTLY